ncbi:hypothetical protein ABW20_dc0106491 [Dactylellina cionopaga]|nr:hypothetical protein ABW20_dc0106491 [Dactylellina cionopaga]
MSQLRPFQWSTMRMRELVREGPMSRLKLFQFFRAPSISSIIRWKPRLWNVSPAEITKATWIWNLYPCAQRLPSEKN